MTARARFIFQASLSLCLALAASASVPALAASPPALAAPASFLIVNPAGRGNQGMAESFLTDFAKAVNGAWPAGSTAEIVWCFSATCAVWRPACRFLPMAGVPLLNGFLSKEMFFAETLQLSTHPGFEIVVPLVAAIAALFYWAPELK